MKVVYSYFVLDIIHRGHLLMLKNSKALAGEDGRLIVGIISDDVVLQKKGALPTLSFAERLELAKALKYADLVVAQDTYSPLDNIKKIKPDILVESEAHDKAQIQECMTFMESIGGKTIVMPYYKGQSSSKIKEAIRNSK